MIANQLEGIINITFIINYIEIMNIYKILYQAFIERKSITFDFFNKYKTYSFKIIFYQNSYYLFLNNKTIDTLTFCSYILTFETLISTSTNLYSDCFINYKYINQNDAKSNFNSEDNKISPDNLIFILKENYQTFCNSNNFDYLVKNTSIEKIKNSIFLLLNKRKNEDGLKLPCNTFFSFLALKINNNFYNTKHNLIETFSDAILSNQNLIVEFTLKNVCYHLNFGFTDVNNLKVTLENSNETYIGPNAFALLYIVSVFYNEDYENNFKLEKKLNNVKRTNRQLLLRAYLLNELINQNKNNSDELLNLVHEYYGKFGLTRVNILFLMMDIEKVINNDSEFQDYSQDKTVVKSWLKSNSNSLLKLSNIDEPDNSKTNTSKKLTKKSNLIYWPNTNKN